MFSLGDILTHLIKNHHISFKKDDYNCYICFYPKKKILLKWIQVGLPVFSCHAPYIEKYKKMYYENKDPQIDEAEMFQAIYNKQRRDDPDFRVVAENLMNQINGYISSWE